MICCLTLQIFTLAWWARPKLELEIQSRLPLMYQNTYLNRQLLPATKLEWGVQLRLAHRNCNTWCRSINSYLNFQVKCPAYTLLFLNTKKSWNIDTIASLYMEVLLNMTKLGSGLLFELGSVTLKHTQSYFPICA